ncbi:CBS domain-containing protein [Roseomonas sp. 18066]|uniref:CBS domain-containing protein n=1 Tax=Roseomonas sp. 18066 TaxID=2681412 RepID=UPI001356C172|nr:CBS domain-containing protein [Roseomonas sp. 18066]
MLVRDVMTRDAMTVAPETPAAALAALFAERGISGVPVVDAAGKLLGMVTEGDLIRQLAAEGEAPRGWFRRLIDSAPAQAEHYARSHGRTARDLMSTGIVSTTEDATVSAAAAQLESAKVRRLPVLRDGQLVGILSRADLMRAVLAPPEAAATAPTDREIHQRLRDAMAAQPWADSYLIFVEVRGGIVTFHGFSRGEEIGRGLRVLAEGIPGVKAVKLDLVPRPAFVLD